MVICQYFLQGRCKFGQNCRFDHSYNNLSTGNKSKNDYSTRNPTWLVEQVTEAEKGGQWPLSCFAPLKEGGSLPGIEDVSPEEVRWDLYQARANGNVDQSLKSISQLYANVEKWRNAWKNPNQEIMQMIVELAEGKKLVTPGNSTSNPSATNNIFGNKPQTSFRFDTAVNSVFGGSTIPPSSTTSIFGGNNQSLAQSNFGSPSQFPASSSQSIFQSPSNQNVFSSSSNTNIFGETQNANVFGGTANVPNFQQSPISVPLFSTNVFGNSSSFNQQQSIFSKPEPSGFPTEQATAFTTSDTSPFQQPKPAQGSHAALQQNDLVLYSKLEDLTEDERNIFMASTFSFGKIPLRPPPQELC